jgi:hypothetical protein
LIAVGEVPDGKRIGSLSEIRQDVLNGASLDTDELTADRGQRLSAVDLELDLFVGRDQEGTQRDPRTIAEVLGDAADQDCPLRVALGLSDAFCRDPVGGADGLGLGDEVPAGVGGTAEEKTDRVR